MDNLEQLYVEFLEFADAKAGEYGTMEVAGVMIAQGLSIYRSALDETDFNKLVDTISASRQEVKTFGQRTIQ
jgi:hypothetical protein